MKSLVILFIILWPVRSSGQTLRRPIGAAYVGAGAYSNHHGDLFSFTSNQAALAQLRNAAAGIYGERRFLLNELSNCHVVAAMPTKSGNFGLKAGYFGFSEYNETQLGLAYARTLGSMLDIGVQFNYNGIKAAGYGNAAAISFEAGTIFHISDKLHSGFHINNPFGGKFGKDSQEKLPSVYTLGFGYEASENFLFCTELIKEENQSINVNAGLQYKFTPRVLVRVGISSVTASAWFGIGLMLHSFRLDVTTSFHPQLGITPGLLLVFDFKSKTQEER